MKRVIKHPDGREETLEGSPEEFRVLDAASRDDVWPALWGFQRPITEQPCMFDGLPPGVYHLACPCPRHGSYC